MNNKKERKKITIPPKIYYVVHASGYKMEVDAAMAKIYQSKINKGATQYIRVEVIG